MKALTPCPYCKRHLDYTAKPPRKLAPTRDHVYPKTLGGTESIICCFQCNNIKGAMIPQQWSHFMVANPNWWKLDKTDLREKRQASIRAVYTLLTSAA